MEATIYILIVLFSIVIILPFILLDDKVSKECKKIINNYVLPVLLIVTDTYCLIVGNIFHYKFFEKLIIIILGVFSIIVSIVVFINNISKKNEYLISLFKCSINIYKVEELFKIRKVKNSYRCFNKDYPTYNLEVCDKKFIIVNKIFYLELIPGKKLCEQELNFVIKQLNKYCDIYLKGDDSLAELKEYKVALFKLKSLYNDYKDIDFKLLEKAKQGEK